MALEPNIDFDILQSIDSRSILLADTSDWKHLYSEASYMDITLPASKTAVTHYFQKEKVNRLNSSNLKYGCTNCEDGLIPLPDGIYKIKVYSCDGARFFKEKFYLRTVRLELRIAELFVSLNLECNDRSSCVRDIFKAELLLKGAKAELIFGNINAAKRKYDKAVEIIDDMEDCDCTEECGDGYSESAY
jgi:hypothetical protein